MRTVFDTNILIDLLQGLEIALTELKRYSSVAISHVTWTEVLVGASPMREDGPRRMLSDFRFIPVTNAIAEQAVLERHQRRIKLPDAIILATAVVEGGVLVTRNTRDFANDESHIRIPYRFPVR